MEQNMPQREKYWKELNSEEKIERMRDIVVSLKSQVFNLNSAIDSLNSCIISHIHDDGKVFIPIKIGERNYSCEDIPRPRNLDEVYF